jgi:hypothetical protein
MIYWYTGQPGHGKTLHAIEKALEFKAAGRIVYVCNVRDFNHEKAGMLPMTPEQFNNWPEFMPDGSVALVDEAYEHGMLPKRGPGAKVPHHVEQLAKHRHRGIDFIFVCQSPDKQVDQFTHDLIERHTHVRRRFGTSYVHLRHFDRYERNPEKGNPLTIQRKRLPKKIFGLYKSTELETTQRKIPWYYFGLALGVPLVLGLAYRTFAGMGERLGGEPLPVPAGTQGKLTEPQGDGGAARSEPITTAQYIARFVPRIETQPWSAPAYDDLRVPSEPPRVFCMIGGNIKTGSCSCLTEQGTRYNMEVSLCRLVAMNGQYEPFRDERETRRADGFTQNERATQASKDIRAGDGQSPSLTGASAPAPSTSSSAEHSVVPAYGAFRR